MDIVKIIHESYLERKPSAEYQQIFNKIIDYEIKLRTTMTDDQQLLLSHLLHNYQELQLLDQPELIAYVIDFINQTKKQ